MFIAVLSVNMILKKYFVNNTQLENIISVYELITTALNTINLSII